jgi:hypothetical protein
MEECSMLKVGDKVIAKKGSNIKELEGKIATIVSNIPIPFLGIDYVVEFDDKEYMKKIGVYSTCCCSKDDIELLKNDNSNSDNDMDVKLSNGDRVITSGTTTIYIMTREVNGIGRVFKGITKLRDGDIYNSGTGIRIAKLKADKKRLETEIKGIEENYNKTINDKKKYLSKIEKELNKYIESDGN